MKKILTVCLLAIFVLAGNASAEAKDMKFDSKEEFHSWPKGKKHKHCSHRHHRKCGKHHKVVVVKL